MLCYSPEDGVLGDDQKMIQEIMSVLLAYASFPSAESVLCVCRSHGAEFLGYIDTSLSLGRWSFFCLHTNMRLFI